MGPDDVRDKTQKEIGVMGYSATGERPARVLRPSWHDLVAEHVHDRRGALKELLARVAAGP